MKDTELKEAINQLKKDKNAVILGHYYLNEELQELSDYTGDSLALAQIAQQCKQEIIVFCGVHFMAETAKILNPTRKVLLPDITATCSLAECCKAEEFAQFKAQYPHHKVISYVNCSAEIKALSDLICTSGNAEKLVRSLPEDQPLIFAPDKNLGGYINRITGRNMVLWDGVCTVHDSLSKEEILVLKEQYPGVPVIAHPECGKEVLDVADFIGSTKAMLNYVASHASRQFIVATEAGILYEMQKNNPQKEFIAIPKNNGCLTCPYMKQNTLEKLYLCLRDETPEILLSDEMIACAEKPIVRMLEMSRQLGIIK